MTAVKPVVMQPGKMILPDKADIVQYMRTREKTAMAPKIFHDPVTDEPIAELDWREDAEYGWSSETTYLFDRYNYPLPESFIEHVRKVLQGRAAICPAGMQI